MNDYARWPEVVSKALRTLRRRGIQVGLPMQKADGDMVFAVEGFTITIAQLLELVDRDELDLDGVRRLIEARNYKGQ